MSQRERQPKPPVALEKPPRPFPRDLLDDDLPPELTEEEPFDVALDDDAPLEDDPFTDESLLETEPDPGFDLDDDPDALLGPVEVPELAETESEPTDLGDDALGSWLGQAMDDLSGAELEALPWRTEAQVDGERVPAEFATRLATSTYATARYPLGPRNVQLRLGRASFQAQITVIAPDESGDLLLCGRDLMQGRFVVSAEDSF